MIASVVIFLYLVVIKPAILYFILTAENGDGCVFCSYFFNFFSRHILRAGPRSYAIKKKNKIMKCKETYTGIHSTQIIRQLKARQP